MNSRPWFTLLLVFFTSALFAQSQQEMNQDAARDAAKADKELNAVYKKVLAGLDAEGAKLLKDSQRAWIAYRDAEAKFAADEARGGSMAPMLFSGTLATLTQERVKRLKEGLESPDDAPPAKASREQTKATLDRSEAESDEHQKHLKKRLEDNKLAEETAPEAKTNGSAGDGASTRRQAAQIFFDAYRGHNKKAAQTVATGKVLGKLMWDKEAGDNPTLKLMDDTHIYYEGGSIELKLQKNDAGKWLVSDIGMTAD